MARQKKAKTKKLAVTTDIKAQSRCLSEVTETYAIAYGKEVVEDRAIPDFRDGLKPVHRAILWAMYDLGLSYTKGFKKAARTVGDVIGRFHPHGDSACYGAMVTIANTKPNLVDGQGNWGDATSGAAAQRYTEARLSEFSCKFLLHPDYLAVTPMVPNFSGDCQMPLFLPCRVPLQMIIGSPTVPAFGVRCGTLPLQYEGVMRLVKKVLRKEKITNKHLLKYLKPNLEWGGEYVGTDAELLEYFNEGKASLKFRPAIEVDEDKRIIYIRSAGPGFGNAKQVATKSEKIGALPGVTTVKDISSSKSPGGYGFEIVINTGRINDDQFADICDKVFALLTTSASYDIGYTKRGVETTSFGRMSVVDFLKRWVKYAISLERRVLEYRRSKEEQKLERQNLLLFAVDNRAIILKSLDSKDPDAYLVKHLKIDAEKAKALLDLQVRRLAKLNRAGILKEIKALKAEIKVFNKWIKVPADHILHSFDQTFFDYLKKTKDRL